MAAAKKKKPIKLKKLQRTNVRPIGLDFTSRYRLFRIAHNGKTYILDRFNNHQRGFDVSNESDVLQSIMGQQWNEDFALYTKEGIDYIFEGEGQNWSYKNIKTTTCSGGI